MTTIDHGTAAAHANDAPPVALSDLPLQRASWREQVRSVADTEVRPRVRQMDQAARIDPELVSALFQAGLMSIEVPVVFGGRGGDLADVALAIEEISRVDPSVGVFVDVHNALVTATVVRHGSGDQKRRYLPKLASGVIGAYALSEDESGSDAFALTTVAEPVAGGYRLTGHKAWTSSAREAGVFLVFAAVETEDGPRRITAFIVDRDTPGLLVGEPVDKLGVRASSTCRLSLDGVRVAPHQVIGQVGDGEVLAVESLNIGKIGIAAQLVGLAQGALDAGVDYAQRRTQFGESIGSFQGVAFPLAEAAAHLHAARVLLYDGIAAMADPDPSRRMTAAATAKLVASQVAERVAALVVEVWGGNGFTEEHPVAKFYRDVKVGKIYEGTTNMQLRTIGSILFGGGLQ